MTPSLDCPLLIHPATHPADPLCDQGSTCRLYEEGGSPYHAILNQAHIIAQTNYVILPLQADGGRPCRRCGRVGEPGQQGPMSSSCAKSEFLSSCPNPTPNRAMPWTGARSLRLQRVDPLLHVSGGDDAAAVPAAPASPKAGQDQQPAMDKPKSKILTRVCRISLAWSF